MLDSEDAGRRGWPAKLDRIQAVALLAWLSFGAAVLVFAEPLSFFNRRGGPGSGFFLKSLAWVLLALVVLRALTMLWAARWERASNITAPPLAGVAEPAFRTANFFRFLALIAALLVYPLVLPLAGFLIATAALGWATLTLLGRHPLRALVEAAAAAFAIRLAFSQGLGVPLPETQFAILRSLGF